MSHKTAAVVSAPIHKILGGRVIAVVVLAVLPRLVYADGGSKPAVSGLLVLAPVIVNPDPQLAWLSSGFQQSLVADLTRHSGMKVQTSGVSTNDSAAAADLARKGDAQSVLIGTIQFAGRDIRFTGEILDISSQRAIVALKVTGRLEDLFEMEDELGAQASRGLAAARPYGKAAAPVIISPSGALRFSYADRGLLSGQEYARPYESDRFQSAQDRYFFSIPQYGWYGCYGGWGYGCGWGYSIYPTASPGWAW